MNRHDQYMQEAIALSLRARGMTLPNPIVGAVIVKNGKVIARGWHKRAGGAHAEVMVLQSADRRARGATLYVTLEPCSTQGRTPPCTEAIIHAGIKKVVVGMNDPNPVHRGRGLRLLRTAGITVERGILQNAIRKTNQPFIKFITRKRPYITVKIAQSLDGKIAVRTRESQWITSATTRRHTRAERSRYDAILVGITTALRDNPRLLPVPIRKGKRFYRIILDTQLRISRSARIFRQSKQYPVIIATSHQALITKKRAVNRLCSAGAHVLGVASKNKHLDLNDLLRQLVFFDISHVLVEGGATVIGSFFDEHLVDYVQCFIAPKIIGGIGALGSVGGSGAKRLSDSAHMLDRSVQQRGEDIVVEGALHYY